MSPRFLTRVLHALYVVHRDARDRITISRQIDAFSSSDRVLVYYNDYSVYEKEHALNDGSHMRNPLIRGSDRCVYLDLWGPSQLPHSGQIVVH